MSLFPQNRILHFIIYKLLFSQATNFTKIMDDELFYIQAIKQEVDFKFPYLILKYLLEYFVRKDVGYLPYGMILVAFFQKAKLKLKKELHFHMPNTTTMITISNLHKRHLTQGDNGHQIRARLAFIPPQPIGEGSSTIREAATTTISTNS